MEKEKQESIRVQAYKQLEEELRETDKSIAEFLKRFNKNIYPTRGIEGKDIEKNIIPIREDIIKIFKEKKLTYVEAYIILESVYSSLKFMSEYTHL